METTRRRETTRRAQCCMARPRNVRLHLLRKTGVFAKRFALQISSAAFATSRLRLAFGRSQFRFRPRHKASPAPGAKTKRSAFRKNWVLRKDARGVCPSRPSRCRGPHGVSRAAARVPCRGLRAAPAANGLGWGNRPAFSAFAPAGARRLGLARAPPGNGPAGSGALGPAAGPRSTAWRGWGCGAPWLRCALAPRLPRLRARWGLRACGRAQRTGWAFLSNTCSIVSNKAGNVSKNTILTVYG